MANKNYVFIKPPLEQAGVKLSTVQDLLVEVMLATVTEYTHAECSAPLVALRALRKGCGDTREDLRTLSACLARAEMELANGDVIAQFEHDNPGNDLAVYTIHRLWVLDMVKDVEARESKKKEAWRTGWAAPDDAKTLAEIREKCRVVQTWISEGRIVHPKFLEMDHFDVVLALATEFVER